MSYVHVQKQWRFSSDFCCYRQATNGYPFSAASAQSKSECIEQYETTWDFV